MSATPGYGLDGQVAVITGAASGFGLAVASRLAAEGSRLVLVDKDAGALKTAAGQLGAPLTVVADVTREQDVIGYMRAAKSAFGQVDLFFNNAGIEGKRGPMTEVEAADFDAVLAVNVRGVFLGLREALRIMKEQGGGAVVNSASMAGLHGSARFSPYVASKHAVIGLSRSAALEGAPFGIRVNAIAPGHIDTRMARALTAQINPDDPEAAYQAIAQRVPMGRYGTADEVGNLVTWLLSRQASYVSGATYLVDGAFNA
jgi:3alpha(or 20beta)-hydroxysteroid dehydrogenase